MPPPLLCPACPGSFSPLSWFFLSSFLLRSLLFPASFSPLSGSALLLLFLLYSTYFSPLSCSFPRLPCSVISSMLLFLRLYCILLFSLHALALPICLLYPAFFFPLFYPFIYSTLPRSLLLSTSFSPLPNPFLCSITFTPLTPLSWRFLFPPLFFVVYTPSFLFPHLSSSVCFLLSFPSRVSNFSLPCFADLIPHSPEFLLCQILYFSKPAPFLLPVLCPILLFFLSPHS